MGTRFAGLLPAPVMRQQPQYAAGIDWSNPITKGVQGAFLPDGDGFLRDYAFGNKFDTSPSAFTTGVGGFGKTVTNGATSSPQSAPDTAGRYALTGAYTYLMLVDIVSFAGPYAGFICRGIGTSSVVMSFQCNAGGNGFSLSHGNSLYSLLNISPATFAGTGKHVFSISYDSADGIPYFHLDGKLVETGSAVASPPAGVGRLVLFGEQNALNQYSTKGSCSGLSIWNRKLSTEEIASLSSNPWQIFRAPAPRRIFGLTPPSSDKQRFAGIAPAPVLRSQPQYAAGIDYGFTKAPALVVSGNTGTPFASLGTVYGGTTVTKFGVGFRTFGSSAGLSWSTQQVVPVTGAMSRTFFARFRLNNTGLNTSILFFGTTLTGCLFSLSCYQGDVVLHWQGAYAIVIVAVQVGIDYDVVCTYDGAVISSYANGAFFRSDTVALNTTLSQLQIGGNDFFTSGCDSILYIGGVIARCFSSVEVKALSDNPWQIFKAPAQRKIFNSAYQASRRVSLAPVVRTSQPQFAAQVDPKFQCRSVLLPALGARDSVPGSPVFNINTGVTATPGSFSFGTTTSGFGYDDAGTNQFRLTNFTKVIKLRLQSLANGFIYTVDNRFNITLGVESVTSGMLGVSWYDGGSFNQISIAPALNTDYTIVVVGASTGVSLYINGMLIGSIASGPIVYSAGRSATYGYASYFSLAGTLFDMQLSAFMPISLSPSAALNLSANPWQLFKPPSRNLFTNSPLFPSKRVSLAPVTRTSQPQFAAQVNWSNPITRGAQAIISAVQDVNAVSSIPLVRAGSGFQKAVTPVGIANAFQKNYYLETELLPALGTASYVEFWFGYLDASRGSAGNTDNEAKFLTGSSANQIGITQNQRIAANTTWGAVNSWGSILDSGETLPAGPLTCLVVVQRQAAMELWHNGVLITSGALTPYNQPAQTMIIGSFVENIAFWTSSSNTVLVGRLQNEWTPQQVKSFSANPWQIFK